MRADRPEWQEDININLYIRLFEGKENGENIMKSIKEGHFIWERSQILLLGGTECDSSTRSSSAKSLTTFQTEKKEGTFGGKRKMILKGSELTKMTGNLSSTMNLNTSVKKQRRKPFKDTTLPWSGVDSYDTEVKLNRESEQRGVFNPGQGKPSSAYIVTGLGHITREFQGPKRLQAFQTIQGLDGTNASPGEIMESSKYLDEDSRCFLQGNSCMNVLHSDSEVDEVMWERPTKKHVVQTNVSSVRNDALMSILDEMYEQGVQSRLANKPDMVVNDTVTAEHARSRHLSGNMKNGKNAVLEICKALYCIENTVSGKVNVHDESKLISKLEGEYLNLQLKYQHLQESFDNKNSQASQEAPDFNSFFKIKNLRNIRFKEKDNVIRNFEVLVANLNDRSCEHYNAKDVTVLRIEQNDCVRIRELEKVKQHYKELYDSIKITRAHTSEKTSTMLNEIESLKAQLRSKEPCFTSDYVKPKVLAPGMSKRSLKQSGQSLGSNTKKTSESACRTGHALVSGLRLFKTYDGESFKAHEFCRNVHLGNFGILSESGLRKHSCFVRDINGTNILKGLSRLKFERIIFAQPCQLGKKQKFSTAKSENTKHGGKFLLPSHGSCVGPMRVLSIKGKKYILSHRGCSEKLLNIERPLLKERNRYTGGLSSTYNDDFLESSHLVHDKKPDLTFFRVFGALCYPTNDSENLGKFQAKLTLGFSLVSSATEINAQVVPPGTSLSTTIAQDAPSTSASSSTSDIHLPVNNREIAKNLFHEGHLIIITRYSYILHKPYHSSEDGPKNNPLETSFGNPFVPVSTRKQDLQSEADEYGDDMKIKARLVAKGYRQEENRISTRWMSKLAFLNGDLQEEVFVRQPEGFEGQGKSYSRLSLKRLFNGT
ncbi:hypothetical protein Tco_0876656 [Tanacetum coccineum]|uniref:Integrase, catalytic region, zinc finger, CCHC-type, peptidase aspartic, catalytic n=1 Tax=Tanacetum coccineum TaxID=301880 RepID=A0ABQ5BSX3_9ASTR